MLATVLLALAVYLNTLGNDFVSDDVVVVLDNPLVHGLGRLREIFTSAYWPGTAELYRPVTLASLALDWQLAGENATWFHAMNMLLHAAVSALLWLLIRRLGASAGWAFAGAAVFAVHPVHVEAVASIVGRAELLAALFVLAACNLYLRWEPGLRLWSVAAVLYLLGLGSKEIAVTLPVLLLLLELHRGGSLRRGVRLLLPGWAAFGATLLAYLALRAQATGGLLGGPPAPYLQGVSTADRIATAVALWPEYLRLMLWPADLSIEWGPPTLPIRSFGDPYVWVSAALMLFLAGAAVIAWKRDQRWLALGITWFGVAVLPVANLVFPIGTILAERTLYLPSVGLALLLPALHRIGALRRPAPQLALFAVLLAGSTRTWDRTLVWRSPMALQGDLLERHPESWRVDWWMAELHTEMGDTARARERFAAASRHTGGNDASVNMAYARFLLRMGELDQAEAMLRNALVRSPGNENATLLLASVLFREERDSAVLAMADSAVSRPHTAPRVLQWMHHHAALADDALGATDQALHRNDLALGQPVVAARASVWMHRARLLAMTGRPAAAQAALDSTGARGITLEDLVRASPRHAVFGAVGRDLKTPP